MLAASLVVSMVASSASMMGVDLAARWDASLVDVLVVQMDVSLVAT
jgi:hypothetical protein